MPAYTPIKLTGRLDTTRVGEIETEFYANVGAVKEGEVVLIDLRDVDFVSSLGIRMLITAGKLLLRRKAELSIVAPQSASVREALQVAGVTELFDFFESEEAARAG